MALTNIVGLGVYFVPLVTGDASIATLYLSIADAILLATMLLLATSAATSMKSRAISE